MKCIKPGNVSCYYFYNGECLGRKACVHDNQKTTTACIGPAMTVDFTNPAYILVDGKGYPLNGKYKDHPQVLAYQKTIKKRKLRDNQDMFLLVIGSAMITLGGVLLWVW